MRVLITAVLVLIASSTILAQDKSALKSETIEVNRSKTSSKSAIKIAVNENRCVLDLLTIRPNDANQIEMHFDFQRPCNKEKQVSITFSNMQDALLIKDIVLNKNDYDLFNLIVDKGKKNNYELRYKK